MGCECFQIGGPFIAEDPDCPAHGYGGMQEQIDDLENERDVLRANLESLKQYDIQTFSDAKALHDEVERLKLRVLDLEQGLDWNEARCSECETLVLVRIECEDHE